MGHKYLMGGKPRDWKEANKIENMLTENHFERTIQNGNKHYLPSLFAGYKRLLLARIHYMRRKLKRTKQAK